jgi:hypothetical protein
VTSTRAILVSEPQRDWLDEHYVDPDDSWSVPGELTAAYDNAGDQPRITHDGPERYWSSMKKGGGPPGFCGEECRVVSAIVVPIEGDA